MASQGTDFTGYVVYIWTPTPPATSAAYYDVYLKLSSSKAVMFRGQKANANQQQDYLFFVGNSGVLIDVRGLKSSNDQKSFYFVREKGSSCEQSTQQLPLNNIEFLQPLNASSLSPQLLHNVAGNVQWLDLEQLQWCPKFQQNRRIRYAQISDGSSTILLTIWHTTIDELNNLIAINNGMAKLSCLKPETFKGQYKLETTLITTVS